jgi:hypothetical protein
VRGPVEEWPSAQVPLNKHMLRAVMHKVLGRGRSTAAHKQIRHARVLICRRTGADVSRWATPLGLAHAR